MHTGNATTNAAVRTHEQDSETHGTPRGSLSGSGTSARNPPIISGIFSLDSERIRGIISRIALTIDLTNPTNTSLNFTVLRRGRNTVVLSVIGLECVTKRAMDKFEWSLTEEERDMIDSVKFFVDSCKLEVVVSEHPCKDDTASHSADKAEHDCPPPTIVVADVNSSHVITMKTSVRDTDIPHCIVITLVMLAARVLAAAKSRNSDIGCAINIFRGSDRPHRSAENTHRTCYALETRGITEFGPELLDVNRWPDPLPLDCLSAIETYFDSKVQVHRLRIGREGGVDRVVALATGFVKDAGIPLESATFGFALTYVPYVKKRTYDETAADDDVPAGMANEHDGGSCTTSHSECNTQATPRKVDHASGACGRAPMVSSTTCTLYTKQQQTSGTSSMAHRTSMSSDQVASPPPRKRVHIDS